MEPVRILGAGPAGLTAGIALARAGREVEVFERNRDVGMRFGGDLQGLENYSEQTNVITDLEGMGLEVNFDCDPFTSVSIVRGDGLVPLTADKPLFYLVKRGPMKGSLDQGLKKQARKAGVPIRFGRTIPREEADIVATGPLMNQVVGIDRGIVFSTSLDDIAIGMMNKKSDVRGYSYLLVTKGYGCLCTVFVDQFADTAGRLAETREIYEQLTGVDIRNPKQVGGVGSFVFHHPLQQGGMRFAGEAGGLQDPLWGFGIRSAMRSGYLAAESILTGNDYRTLIRQHFEKKKKAGIVNRFLWELLLYHNPFLFSKRMKQRHIPFQGLLSFHQFNTVQKMLYPVAYAYLKRRNRDWFHLR